MSESIPRVSARDLKVPQKIAVAPKPLGKETLLERLIKINPTLGKDKNDAVAVLIQICLNEKVCRGSTIVDLLDRVGHNRGHVWSILSKEAKRRKRERRWWSEGKGQYVLAASQQLNS